MGNNGVNNDKTALITGASSGIGEMFARQLGARGYSLVITARREDLLERVAEDIRMKNRVRVEVLPADLSLPAGIQSVVEKIGRLGRLDLLVNNAGFGVAGPFDQTSIDRYLAMEAVHIRAVIQLSHAALNRMLDQGNGGLINVSSPAAYIPIHGNCMYSSTKAWMNTFTRSLHEEYRHRGIYFQILLPGFTISGFHKTPDYQQKRIYSTIPRFLWMESDAVVHDSLYAMDRGSLICIPGIKNQIIVFLGKLGLLTAVSNLSTRILKMDPAAISERLAHKE